MEGALSGRVVGDDAQPGDFLLNEARFRLDLARYADRADVQFKGDALADALTGEVAWDVRRALVTLRPGGAVTLRVGRQVSTWGTGDLVFLNDLFPKDFVAFFTGRDVESLKAPANALRTTLYRGAASTRVGADQVGDPLVALRPDDEVGNGEVAGRLFGGVEVAGYAYAGFSKQPVALDAAAGLPTFAPLHVYGASVRGPLLGGLSNAEVAYYDARTDRAGDDLLLPNGQARWLVGHEREVFSDVTLGLQYYAERTLRYDRLLAVSPSHSSSRARHGTYSRAGGRRARGSRRSRCRSSRSGAPPTTTATSARPSGTPGATPWS